MQTRCGRLFAALLLLGLSGANCTAQDWDKIQLHGFATQGILFSSNNNYLSMKSSEGSFQWTDAAVSITDPVSDKLRIGMQLHIYQLGQFGGPGLQVDWASGDYKVNDYFGIRAGKIKTAIGLFNDFQDVDPVYLWALLPQSVYPVDNRAFMLTELGGELYGEVGIGPRRGKLRYRLHTGASSLDQNQGYIKQLAEVGLTFSNSPQCFTYGGDLRWASPVRGWTLGASGLRLKMDGTALDGGGILVHPFFAYALYSQFSRGKWFFAGEYWRVPANPTLTIQTMNVPWPMDLRSWYAMGSYQVSKKLRLGTYYSHYVNKAEDTSLAQNYAKDYVISGRYNFNDYFYGKLEGHFLHGTGQGYYGSTNPDGLNPDSRMLAARIGFAF